MATTRVLDQIFGVTQQTDEDEAIVPEVLSMPVPQVTASSNDESLAPQPQNAVDAPVARDYDEEERQRALRDQEQDFSSARQNIKVLLTSVDDAIDHALETIRTEATPRSIEAYAKLLETATNVNKSLLELHQIKQDTKTKIESPKPKKSDEQSGNVNVENGLIFTGSSKELLDLINKDRT